MDAQAYPPYLCADASFYVLLESERPVYGWTLASAHPETGLLGIGADESAYLLIGETERLHNKVGG